MSSIIYHPKNNQANSVCTNANSNPTLYLFIINWVETSFAQNNQSLSQSEVKLALRNFFKSTFIRKETVDWSPAKKAYVTEGYNPQWSLFRFHHVCIQRGKEGVIVGTDDNYDITWKINEKDVPSRKYIVEPGEWNAMRIKDDFRNNKLMDSYMARMIDTYAIQNLSKILLFKGSSFGFNCYIRNETIVDRRSQETDWMIKLGILYELTTFSQKNGGELNFKNPWKLPFRSIFMNLCSDPALTPWGIGQSFYKTILNKLFTFGLAERNFTEINISKPNEKSDELYCFEDLHMSTRVNMIMQGSENMVNLRSETAAWLQEPAEIGPLLFSASNLTQLNFINNLIW